MLIISSLVSVSVEIPFTCQSSNSTTSFVLFFVIKTPVWRLDSGLTDGGGECGEDGGRQRGGGWTMQEMLRVSSRSDENILNANLKGLQKNAQEGDWNSNMHCILCYDSSML